jgi:hypothetical protein
MKPLRGRVDSKGSDNRRSKKSTEEKNKNAKAKAKRMGRHARRDDSGGLFIFIGIIIILAAVAAFIPVYPTLEVSLQYTNSNWSAQYTIQKLTLYQYLTGPQGNITTGQGSLEANITIYKSQSNFSSTAVFKGHYFISHGDYTIQINQLATQGEILIVNISADKFYKVIPIG